MFGGGSKVGVNATFRPNPLIQESAHLMEWGCVRCVRGGSGVRVCGGEGMIAGRGGTYHTVTVGGEITG